MSDLVSFLNQSPVGGGGMVPQYPSYGGGQIAPQTPQTPSGSIPDIILTGTESSACDI